MMYVLVVILLIVVIIFGVSSGMQSFASAQQAQAQIETAKVAQISSWGNLIVILILALVIVVALGLILFALYHWRFFRLNKGQAVRRAGRDFSQASATEIDPNAALGQLVQLETLRVLRSLSVSADTRQSKALLTAPREEEPAEEFFPWLR